VCPFVTIGATSYLGGTFVAAEGAVIYNTVKASGLRGSLYSAEAQTSALVLSEELALTTSGAVSASSMIPSLPSPARISPEPGQVRNYVELPPNPTTKPAALVEGEGAPISNIIYVDSKGNVTIGSLKANEPPTPNVITDPSRLLEPPKDRTPELSGAPIESDIIPAGTQYYQAVSPGQKSPGAFATTDDIPNAEFVRNDLAVIPPFKPELSGVRKVEVIRDVRGQSSTVGPQKYGGVTYEGGASQVQFLEHDSDNPFVKFVGDEVPFE